MNSKQIGRLVVGALSLLLGFFVAEMPIGCSSNNNPTSPNTPTVTSTIWANYTQTFTNTPTSTASWTPTNINGFTSTITPTGTPTPTPTDTPSFTPTGSFTATFTQTITSSPTNTPFPSPTAPFIGSGPSTIQYPNGIIYSNSNSTFYVAEGNGSSNGEVLILNNNLTPTASISSYGTTAFGNPNGVAVNSAATTVYVLDSVNNAVYAYNAAGATLITWSSWSGSGTTSFLNPEGIAVDGSGHVYVADTGNDQVVEFDNAGTQLNQWTSGASSFDSPSAVAVDGTGNLYVADALNDQVQVYNGSSWTSWSSNVPGFFNSDIFGIATDGIYVYLADAANGFVSKFSVGGIFQTATDNPTSPLQDPDGLALYSSKLYVTDFTAPSGKGSIQIFGQ